MLLHQICPLFLSEENRVEDYRTSLFRQIRDSKEQPDTDDQ